MSARLFIQKENITMLWDVISDEEVFRFLPRDSQASIYQLFMNNLQGFYENERKKTNSFMEINKKYIMLILRYIKQNFPVPPSKITIHNEAPSKQLITFEEIQNDKKSKFEEELTRKQEEFEDFMNVKIPPVPEFTDKDTDKPIKEMDKILKEMQMQRNYEIEQINRSHNNNNNSQSQLEKWLKPQDTSIKPKLDDMQTQNQIIDKKNVSFSNVEEIITDEYDDDVMFSKLKKVSIKNDEVRILSLENEVKILNSKIDKILDLLTSRL